jgi:hypothetical protein
MRKHIWFLITLFIFLDPDSEAQNFEICPESGFGRTSLTDNLPNLSTLNIFDNTISEYFRIGLVSYYTPDSSIFSFKSGILYNYVGDNIQWNSFNKLKIIQIPIGCNLRSGRKYYFIIGWGLVVNYLIAPKGLTADYPMFQIGLNTDLGMGLEVSKLLGFEIKYQLGFDITKLNTVEYHSYFSGSSNHNKYSYNGILCLSLKYKIIKK